MNIKGIGIDIVEIRRFRKIKKDTRDRFLSKNFSSNEITYAFSYKDWATHLAGTFAAKESVVKALGRSDFLISVIEIRRASSGKPEVFIKNRKRKDILTTITHSTQMALAVSLYI